MHPAMPHHNRNTSAASKWYTIAAGSTAVLLVICIVSYPDAAFRASLQGLKVWWNIIFPALLPFLVLSQLLLAYGWVHGLGVLLNPIMRLLFRLPGVSGWAWAVGWTAGYPAGAEAVVKMREQKLITQQEGERLLSLSHAGSPVFIIAVVGVGFMQQADTGLLLALVHWLSALAVVIFLRIVSKRDRQEHFETKSRSIHRYQEEHEQGSLLKQMLSAMENAHRADGRPLGKLLGDSVSSAVQTLMMIGGYMMIFSVLIQVARLAIPQQYSAYLMNGLLEVNLGTFAIGTGSFNSPIFQTALVGAVLGWSGASAHLQVFSLIRGSDLRYSRFFISRLTHALTAFVLTYVCWNPFHNWNNGTDSTKSAFLQTADASSTLTQSTAFWQPYVDWMVNASFNWYQSVPLLATALLLIVMLTVMSIMLGWFKRIR